ncbi:MAG: DeoR/GlpR transcriptional regulator [Bacteroidetes bacterium]|nr:MAG: DeoR/GlpR transcriptional regulator [Bacteroidota bacterium]
MLKEERHAYILQRLSARQKVLTSSLSEELSVSEDTIRRDLKELADNGQLRKVHGGALPPSHNPYAYRDREVYALESKIKIAEKARSLIQDGQVVLMDGGTTNLELVKRLPQDLHATFFTNSLPVAVQLSGHPHIEVIFAGGKLLKDAQATIGLEVVHLFSEIRADICILGTRSLHHEAGITEINWEEAQVKRSLVQAAKKVVALVISEKIDTLQPYTVCDIKGLHTVVTELDTTDEILIPYKKRGIVLI